MIYNLTVKIEGPCIECGNDTFISVNFTADTDCVDLKGELKKKQDIIHKEIKSIICEECFLKSKFNLSDAAIEVVSSSSSSN